MYSGRFEMEEIMKKEHMWKMVILLGTGLFLAGCGKSTDTSQTLSSAVVVDAKTAAKGDLTLQNQFVGTVSPEQSVAVIPMAQGTVTDTFFEVGDTVEAGDVLFKIDDSAAKLQLEQAQLSYSNAKQQADSALTTQQESAGLQLDSALVQAKAQYEALQISWVDAGDQLDKAEDAVEKLEKQYRQLKKDETTPEDVLAQAKTALTEARSGRDQLRKAYNQVNSQYEAAKTAYELAQQSKELTQGDAYNDTKKSLDTSLKLAGVGVDSAELALSYYSVTTPISGKVISKNVEVNGLASASAGAAYVIAAQDSMLVTYQVSEAVRNTLEKGQEIQVERNGVTYPGIITEIGNAVNMQTGLFKIQAAVQADGSELPSGVSVKITSDTYSAKDQIIIPYDAVYYETDGTYVYVAENGTAVKTYVTTGIFNEESIEITEGLKEGDLVITSWSPRLIDGVEVETK